LSNHRLIFKRCRNATYHDLFTQNDAVSANNSVMVDAYATAK